MLAAGTSLGSYKILALLGTGGMGEVYRAHDPRLQRDIALKVLPALLTGEATARARLIREARSAAALSHPNICTVHEVSEADGHVYIAMELVEGQPLSERIGGKPLPVESVIRYGAQIAEALAHAHERHVIHRDLKSGNVMVAPDGRVKVLDFGLAKRVWEADEQAPTEPQVTLTETGAVVGTPHYLAPEVLRGAKADGVSDVWALGVVLYEMTAGKLPFQGRTAYELSAAIVNETPAPLAERVPAGLRAVIAGCLAKQRGERIQRAGEVRAALEALRSDAAVAPGGGRARLRKGVRAVLSLITLALVATAAWLAWPHVTPKRPLVERQLTSNPADLPVLCLALSSDGKYLAYSDSMGVHVLDIGSGETRLVPLPPGVRYGCPTGWSPDGSKFLIHGTSSAADTTGGIWEISLLGWVTRRLRPNGFQPSMSPDGSQVAFLPYDERELWLMRVGGEEARRVLSFQRVAGNDKDDEHNRIGRAVWSPDGKRIAFPLVRWLHVKDSILLTIECLDVKSGQRTTLLNEENLGGLQHWGVWMPDGRIVYARTDSLPSENMNLWQINVDVRHGKRSGEPRRITNWAGGRHWPVNASADGRQLLYQKSEANRDVYVAGITETGAIWDPPRRLTLSDRQDVLAGWTADGGAVFFVSDREGTPKLFRQRVGQRNAEALVAAPGWDWSGESRTTSDGELLLYSRLLGEWSGRIEGEIMRVSTTGGPPERVLVSTKLFMFACALWPQSTCVMGELAGDTLVFSRVEPRVGRGGEMARIRLRDVMNVPWAWDLSPDGSRVAVVERDTIRVLDLPSHEVSMLVLRNADQVLREGGPWGIWWAPSGRGFLLFTSHLLYVDPTGQARTVFQELPISLVPSPDGRRIAFTRSERRTNAWLLQGF